jgi:hypothetical protein
VISSTFRIVALSSTASNVVVTPFLREEGDHLFRCEICQDFRGVWNVGSFASRASITTRIECAWTSVYPIGAPNGQSYAAIASPAFKIHVLSCRPTAAAQRVSRPGRPSGLAAPAADERTARAGGAEGPWTERFLVGRSVFFATQVAGISAIPMNPGATVR